MPFPVTPMMVGQGLKAVGGVVQLVDGAIKAKEAKRKAEEAEREMEKQKNLFASLDTSNPYLNMENTMEDLTVNQKEAQFMAQQSQQSQANILQQMRGAAGGSGIAALAQTLANQGALESQKAAASIGAQEAANRQLRAQEASRIQDLEREGEVVSRQAEADKVGTLLGMAAEDAAAQRDAQQQFRTQAIQGLGSAIQGGIGIAGEFGGSESLTDVTNLNQAPLEDPLARANQLQEDSMKRLQGFDLRTQLLNINPRKTD